MAADQEVAPVAPSLRPPTSWWIPVVLMPTLNIFVTVWAAIAGAAYVAYSVGGVYGVLGLGAAAVAVRWYSNRVTMASPGAPTVVVVGAGFNGVNMAIQLRRRGYKCKVVERSEKVGGTWYDNRYPGIACDIYSHLYSYSYAPNTEWTQSFSSGSEIQSYIEGVARRFGVMDCISFSTELVSAKWDDGGKRWNVVTRGPGGSQTESFDVLVAAVGLFPQARMPRVEGVDSFKGKLVHSREWDPSFNATGKTVAVVGTGASAVQIIPRLAQQAKELKVFQRSPGWIIPKQDYLHPEWLRILFRYCPLFLWAHRMYFWIAIELFTVYTLCPQLESGLPSSLNRRFQGVLRWFARWQITRNGGSQELVAQVMPKGAFGNKRPALSSEYWPALCLPNVELVPHAVEKITETGLATAARSYDVDAIVFATGFNMLPHPTSDLIFGADGTPLSTAYTPSTGLHLGMVSPDFPNLFQLFGPGSLGHNNLVTQAELQADYVVRALEAMQARRCKAVAVKRDVQKKYLADRACRLKDTVFHTTNSSWYLTPGREVWTHHAGGQYEYWRSTRVLRESDFEWW